MEYIQGLQRAVISLPSPLITFVLSSFIFLACYSGDWLLYHADSSYPDNLYFRAIVDSSAHAAVGYLSWAVVEGDRLLVDFHSCWINCFVCAFLSALVDVDHFLAAGSLDIQRAVSLQRRPPFHNTSIIPAVVLLCWILKRFIPGLGLFGLLFLVAWFSHHLRDAHHRGLWLYPFDHTPLFSFMLYVSCIIALAICVRYVYSNSFQKPQRTVVAEGNIV